MNNLQCDLVMICPIHADMYMLLDTQIDGISQTTDVLSELAGMFLHQ